MIRIETLIYNSFQVNTYLLSNEQKEAIVIDAAFDAGPEQEGFDRLIRDKGFQVVGQLNTHCHIDHIIGVQHISEQYGAGLRAHADELPILNNAPLMAEMFGFELLPPGEIDTTIADQELIMLGGDEIRAIHVPGHSPGSLAYYVPGSGFVVTGDALFRGSIGRTDLPGGNHETLIAAIRTGLLTLPPETLVYPGHGPSSTIGKEDKDNPFL